MYQKYKITVPDGYIESLCKAMREWCAREDSLTIPQFLKYRGLANFYLQNFIEHYPEVKACLDVVKSTLCVRWINMALNEPNLSPTKAKVLLRYVRIYDLEGLQTEREGQAALKEVERTAELQFYAENFANENLTGVYKSHYDSNVNKSRSRKEA
jgi:hypothetical protein